MSRVINKSNSAALTIERIQSDRHVSPEVRMAAVYAVAADWKRAVAYESGRTPGDGAARSLYPHAFIGNDA